MKEINKYIKITNAYIIQCEQEFDEEMKKHGCHSVEELAKLTNRPELETKLGYLRGKASVLNKLEEIITGTKEEE